MTTYSLLRRLGVVSSIMPILLGGVLASAQSLAIDSTVFVSTSTGLPNPGFGQVNTMAIVRIKPNSVSAETAATDLPVVGAVTGLLHQLGQESGGDLYVDLTPDAKLAVRLYVRVPSDERRQGVLDSLKQLGLPTPVLSADYWRFDLQGAQRQTMANVEREDLNAGLDLVASHDVRIAVALPQYLRKGLLEILPPRPPEEQGLGFRSWLQEVESISLGVNLTASASSLRVLARNEQVAQRLTGQLSESMGLLAGKAMPGLEEEYLQSLPAILSKLQPTTIGSVIEYQLSGDTTVALLEWLNDTLMSQASSEQRMQHMRQIALAIHNYAEAWKSLPPAKEHRDEDGQSKLSWRVYILPFIDQVELFNQFRLDEPWDSPHNKALLPRMPEIYNSRLNALGIADRSQRGYTTFLAPVGGDTIFGQSEPVRFRDVLDGTSNTAMLVEVRPELAVPWTAPQDYQFDPRDPLAGLRMDQQGRFLMLMADGSTVRLNRSIGNELLLSLFGKADRQIIDWNQLQAEQ